MHKRLLVGIIAAICLSLSIPAMADELSFGGAWVDGHSYSNNYGVNNDGSQSWGLRLHYEKDKDWKKAVGDHSTIGIDPGMMYMYLRWTKTHNRKKTTCIGYECEDTQETTVFRREEQCTTKEYNSNETINSHIFGVYGKPYLQYRKVRFFALGGIGAEFEDSSDINMAFIGGGGIQYQFTKSFALSATQYEIWTDEKRLDTSVISLDYRW